MGLRELYYHRLNAIRFDLEGGIFLTAFDHYKMIIVENGRMPVGSVCGILRGLSALSAIFRSSIINNS